MHQHRRLIGDRPGLLSHSPCRQAPQGSIDLSVDFYRLICGVSRFNIWWVFVHPVKNQLATQSRIVSRQLIIDYGLIQCRDTMLPALTQASDFQALVDPEGPEKSIH